MTSLSLPSIFFLHHENGQGKHRAISTYCCYLVASRNPSSQLFMRTCHFAGINFLDFLFGDQIVSLLLLRVDRNQVSPSTQETSLNSSSGVVLLLIRPSDVRHASCCMIICALPAKQWGGHLCFALEIIETPMESFSLSSSCSFQTARRCCSISFLVTNPVEGITVSARYPMCCGSEGQPLGLVLFHRFLCRHKSPV